jgi:hypothetical protein
MTSGGGPEGYCKQCGNYSQSRSIKFAGLCMACEYKNRIDELLTDPPVWHKRLFDTLVGAYDEVEAMGVDPELLMRRWRKRGEK